MVLIFCCKSKDLILYIYIVFLNGIFLILIFVLYMFILWGKIVNDFGVFIMWFVIFIFGFVGLKLFGRILILYIFVGEFIFSN